MKVKTQKNSTEKRNNTYSVNYNDNSFTNFSSGFIVGFNRR